MVKVIKKQGNLIMNGNTNNKYIVIFMLLTSISFNNLSATPKTWTKDESGRVLIYRAEPSKLEAFGWTAMSGLGIAMTSGGVCSAFKSNDNLPMIFCGGVISAVGIYKLYEWYHNYSSLYKPLIVIDKYGITYEGKNKITWKRVCSYDHELYTVYVNGVRDHDVEYIEISTDTEKLQIMQHNVAITSKMLYKLIDESYKEYQKLEKEHAAIAA
jgi:hypothetical protein